MREEIIKAIAKAAGVPEDQVALDLSDNELFGDYSTNISLKNKNPREFGEGLHKKLVEDSSLKQYVSDIQVAGAGFINFFIDKKYLFNNLQSILDRKEDYGKGNLGKGKKVIVEYSSPNIAKPFTVGHLRSTIIGDAIANLLQTVGYEVYRDNHLGDWGTQFGKLIYMIKNIKSDLSSLNIKDLVLMYVEFHKQAKLDKTLEDRAREEFKKLEDGDSENREIWQYCVEVSMKEFDRIYDLLNIHFTENEGKGYPESYFEDKMKEVISDLESSKLLQKGTDGAMLVFFENEEFPPLMILKKDGSTLYSTRDLATDKFRKEKYGEQITIINEVGAEQTLYFRQLYKVEELLGWFKPGQRVHIKHGHFRFADKKMSTRSGNVIWLQDVIDEALKRAKKLRTETEELSKDVAVGALKWNELKRDPVSDIVFDWRELLNMQGNSGPYVQYTYARAKSVLRKAKFSNSNFPSSSAGRQFSMKFQLSNEEMSLMRYLARFDEVLVNAAKSYSPHTLADYLYKLAQKYNTFYNKEKILESEKEEFRLALSMAVSQIIKNGLLVLGIKAPERM